MILNVWDGLRPDSVSQRDTPNLFALAHDGVRFDRHHSQYPTITMVNAATLATGAPPGVTGIYGDWQYLGPSLLMAGASLSNDGLGIFDLKPAMLENTKLLMVANASDGFNGRLLGIDTIAQEVAREGGYVAVLGKEGPTYLFDDRVATVGGGADMLHQKHSDNYLFAADDFAAPPDQSKALLDALPAATRTGVSDRERDAYFARLVAERAIPAAKRATDEGHPALIVFWQHNPDLTQHRAGLGTAEAITSLSTADDNLAKIRAALAANGVENNTDVIVVSDHGFATIRLRVNLGPMLVAAGLKKSDDSTDVLVAPNGGSDLIYLSDEQFKGRAARADRLQKIVNFCEAQEWCGPIFSREAAPVSPGVRGNRAHLYLGWIDGTFAQSSIGLASATRSPDLIVSFREIPDLDNSQFTGPGKLAFSIGAKGQEPGANHSAELVRPVKGAVYADLGKSENFTTGMGMHGAAGSREIHNFGAAAGPDFKRHYVDLYPTGNIDIAPTIEELLGLMPNVGPGGAIAAGRALVEALADGHGSVGAPHAMTMRTDLELAGVEAITTLRVTKLGERLYLDDSTVDRKPLGSSP